MPKESRQQRSEPLPFSLAVRIVMALPPLTSLSAVKDRPVRSTVSASRPPKLG